MLFLIGQPVLSFAIIQLHALSLLQKMLQIRDQFFLYMDPESRLDNMDMSAKQAACSRLARISTQHVRQQRLG